MTLSLALLLMLVALAIRHYSTRKKLTALVWLAAEHRRRFYEITSVSLDHARREVAEFISMCPGSPTAHVVVKQSSRDEWVLSVFDEKPTEGSIAALSLVINYGACASLSVLTRYGRVIYKSDSPFLNLNDAVRILCSRAAELAEIKTVSVK